MKLKTVCFTMAIATGMIFVSQTYVVAQNSPNQSEKENSKASNSLEVQWFFGIIPWLRSSRNSNSYNRYNSGNRTASNNFIQTKIDSPNRLKLIGTKERYNHKEVPVPFLIPGLAILGAGLIRKHHQEQKLMEMK